MSQFNQKILTIIITFFGLIFVPHLKAALVEDLKDGQHILLIRHADAPGFGDPKDYIIGQCSTQRNLDDHGKKQAKAIGTWLSIQGIDKALIFSSPWCRCLDTAQLMNLGSVKIEPSLGSFFDDMGLEKKQTKELEQFIKKELGNQAQVPIVLVTHHVNIQAYTGKVVGVGDMVLVKVNKNGEHLAHVIYPSPKP